MERYILIAGLGKSGISAAYFFKKQGYNVIATDINPAQKKNPKIIELEAMGIKTEIGFHNISTFENADMIIVSPGIPLDGDHFKRAVQKAVPIRGELDIAAEYIKEPIIAITGTNGKTTVTTLVSEMLKCSGLKVFTGGNIGTPLIEYFNHSDSSSFDAAVVEVSSFQLDTAKNFCPDAAVLLNITEDHLNRYPDFKAYEDSKWSIFANQNEKCHAIINSSIHDAEDRAAKMSIKSKITYFNNFNFDENINFNTKKNINFNTKNSSLYNVFGSFDKFQDIFCSLKKFSKLKGKHNEENIEASIFAALAGGASMEGIETALKNFKGLSHRIEYVANINGIDFYNDSKGTNTDAAARAVEAFDDNYNNKHCVINNKKNFNEKIILIMGGQDKNMDFSVLKEWFKGRVKKIVLIGQAKDKIYQALAVSSDTSSNTLSDSYDISSNTISNSYSIMFADNMEHAVNTAFNNAVSGDTVLLSPACASFDMYNSYTERGDDFVRQVKKLVK